MANGATGRWRRHWAGTTEWVLEEEPGPLLPCSTVGDNEVELGAFDPKTARNDSRCQADGLVQVASVVDHMVPVTGPDDSTFFEPRRIKRCAPPP